MAGSSVNKSVMSSSNHTVAVSNLCQACIAQLLQNAHCNPYTAMVAGFNILQGTSQHLWLSPAMFVDPHVVVSLAMRPDRV